jgi:hypothetical protein
MKVKDLRAALAGFDDDLEVVIQSDDVLNTWGGAVFRVEAFYPADRPGKPLTSEAPTSVGLFVPIIPVW